MERRETEWVRDVEPLVAAETNCEKITSTKEHTHVELPFTAPFFAESTMNSPVQWGLSQMKRRMALFNSQLFPGVTFEFTVHRQQTKSGTTTVRCQRCIAANKKRQQVNLEKGPICYLHVTSLEDGATWLGDPDSGHGCLDDGMVDCTEARSLARQTYKKAVFQLESKPCSLQDAYTSILQGLEGTSSTSLHEIIEKLPDERTARRTIGRHLEKSRQEADSNILMEMDNSVFSGLSTPFFVENEEDDESEATKIFKRQVNRDYEREIEMPTSAVSRRLNFDDSFMSDKTTGSKLLETEEELSAIKRLLRRSRDELALTQQRETAANEKIAALEKKLNEAKETTDKFRRFSEMRDNMSIRHKVAMDELKTIANKYRTWYEFSQAQLRCAKDIMTDAKMWNRENRSKLYVSYMKIEPMLVKDSEIAELAKGSIQDYPAIEEYASIEQSPDDTNDSEGYDSSTFNQKIAEAVALNESMVEQPTINLFQKDDADELNSSCNAQDMLICGMRQECEELKKKLESTTQRLKVANEQIRQQLVLREQIRDLEEQLSKENNDNAALHVKLEKLKNAVTKDLCSDKMPAQERTKASEVIDTVLEMKVKNQELEKKLAHCWGIEKELKQTRMRLNRTETENRELRVKAHTGKVAECMLEEKQLEIDALRARLEELDPPTPTPELADADSAEVDAAESDETKILQFDNNPKKLAMDQIRKQDSNKRARPHSTSDVDENPAKRLCDEEAIEWKKRCEQAEARVKNASSEYQQLIQRYRRWCQNLTGYQIKMREQVFCEVASIYDPENSFSFKYNEETKGYELLETEYIARWGEQVESYLDCGHSIPAFLAAVTLELEQEAMNQSRL